MNNSDPRKSFNWEGRELLIPSYISIAKVEEFFSRTNRPSDPDACWEWTGPTRPEGYGWISMPSGPMPAHRFAFNVFVGDLEKGNHVHHECKNEGCVNPLHLVQVSAKDHVLKFTPLSITAINAAKKYCPRGHLLEGDNLRTRHDGHRSCKICLREDEAKRRAAEREARGPKVRTHCKYGHEWVDENIGTDAYGRQFCKICRKKVADEWYARKKESAAPKREKRTTHCKRGHELTPENTYKWIDKRTGKECQTCHQCKKDAMRGYKRKGI